MRASDWLSAGWMPDIPPLVDQSQPEDSQPRGGRGAAAQNQCRAQASAVARAAARDSGADEGLRQRCRGLAPSSTMPRACNSETTSDCYFVPKYFGAGLRFALRHHEGTEPIFFCMFNRKPVFGRYRLAFTSHRSNKFERDSTGG